MIPRSSWCRAPSAGVYGGSGSGEGCAASLAQAARVHAINNHVVLGKHCKESTVAASPLDILSSLSRSSC